MVSPADVKDWLTHLISFDATRYYKYISYVSIKYGWTSDSAQVYCLHCDLMLSWSLMILIETTKNVKKKGANIFKRLYCQSAHVPILKSFAVLSAKLVITGAKRHTSRAKAAPGQANPRRHQNQPSWPATRRKCLSEKLKSLPTDFLWRESAKSRNSM